MPKCKICGSDTNDFYPSNKSTCVPCVKERYRKWIEANKERQQENIRRWTAEHREEINEQRRKRLKTPEAREKANRYQRDRYANNQAFREKRRADARHHHQENPEPRRESTRKSRMKHKEDHKASGLLRLNSLRNRARHRGIACHLDIAWYRGHVWGKPCSYCGEDSYGGVDRVDNDIGYDPANCVPCCQWCNTIKLDWSAEDMVEHLERILGHKDSQHQSDQTLMRLDRSLSSSRLGRIRKEAGKRKLPITITLKWYRASIWGKPCSYCGMDSAGGIDRIDNSRGYEPDNCAPCCHRCNCTKFTHTKEEMLTHIRKIVDLWKLHGSSRNPT